MLEVYADNCYFKSIEEIVRLCLPSVSTFELVILAFGKCCHTRTCKCNLGAAPAVSFSLTGSIETGDLGHFEARFMTQRNQADSKIIRIFTLRPPVSLGNKKSFLALLLVMDT